MNSWGHPLICQSRDESGWARVFNARRRSEQTWQHVCGMPTPTQDLHTEELSRILLELLGAVHSLWSKTARMQGKEMDTNTLAHPRTQRSPPSPHRYTHRHTHIHTHALTHITLCFPFAEEVVAKAQKERADWLPLLITGGTHQSDWLAS